MCRYFNDPDATDELFTDETISRYISEILVSLINTIHWLLLAGLGQFLGYHKAITL